MFYQEHEKRIYSPPDSAKKFDPLAVDRALTIASGGRLNEYLGYWTAPTDGMGDISPETKAKNLLLSAQAEEELVRISREVFGILPFPEAPDALALTYLRHYLEWMQGKGSVARKPQ